ncbi:hypothetical protein GQX74_015691 [Glossina fuscipes]|nr:hypothetical protein GQX74_015691 [Glossina fuscipes]
MYLLNLPLLGEPTYECLLIFDFICGERCFMELTQEICVRFHLTIQILQFSNKYTFKEGKCNSAWKCEQTIRTFLALRETGGQFSYDAYNLSRCERVNYELSRSGFKRILILMLKSCYKRLARRTTRSMQQCYYIYFIPNPNQNFVDSNIMRNNKPTVAGALRLCGTRSLNTLVNSTSINNQCWARECKNNFFYECNMIVEVCPNRQYSRAIYKVTDTANPGAQYKIINGVTLIKVIRYFSAEATAKMFNEQMLFNFSEWKDEQDSNDYSQVYKA